MEINEESNVAEVIFMIVDDNIRFETSNWIYWIREVREDM